MFELKLLAVNQQAISKRLMKCQTWKGTFECGALLLTILYFVLPTSVYQYEYTSIIAYGKRMVHPVCNWIYCYRAFYIRIDAICCAIDTILPIVSSSSTCAPFCLLCVQRTIISADIEWWNVQYWRALYYRMGPLYTTCLAHLTLSPVISSKQPGGRGYQH